MKTNLIFMQVVALSAMMTTNALAVSGGMSLEENFKLVEEYPPVEGQTLANACSACHGTHGQEFGEAMPPLAGMPKETFIKLMTKFKEERSPSIVMNKVAKFFSAEEIDRMAEFFAKQPAVEWTRPDWNTGVKDHE